MSNKHESAALDSKLVKSKTGAAILGMLCMLSLSGRNSFACTPITIPWNISDVVADGTIHVIEQHSSEADGRLTYYGRAVVTVTKIHRNRIHLKSPFTFSYEAVSTDDCAYGDIPEDGSTVRVFLARTNKSSSLTLVAIRSTEGKLP
jgi:hypothetical protein